MLCGCFSKPEEPPTPLDAPISRTGGCGAADCKKGEPNVKQLSFPLYGATNPNFDFVADDNGDNHIGKFRATLRGEVIGRDSKPIPKAVYDTFQIIKKKKSKTAYCIDIDTGGVDIFHYFRTIDEETARQLGVEFY